MSNVSSDVMVRPRSSGKLWFQWSLAHVVLGFLGWAIACALGFMSAGAGLLAAGGIVGALVGCAQAFLLRKWLKGIGWEQGFDRFTLRWTGSTVLGGTAALIFGLASILFLATVLPGANVRPQVVTLALSGITLGLSGAALGFCQWIVMREFLRSSQWWIPLNALGLGVGMFAGIYVGNTFYAALVPDYSQRDNIMLTIEEYAEILVTGTVATAILGAVTGTGLLWLLRRQPQ